MQTKKLKHAFIETTNYCNLDCVFCNRRDVVNNKNLKHMSLNEWNKILQVLSDHPLKDAKLQGLGEPFFHPQYDVITESFKNKFPDCFVITATNLQYKIKGAFKDKFFKSLSNIDLLYLSIDGYKETYEAARPGAKWEQLIRSLEIIERELPKKDIKTRFEINFVATPETISSLEKVIEIQKKYNFIHDIRVNLAQWWGEESLLELDYSKEYLSVLKRYKDKVKGKSPWDFKDCFWPSEGIHITANGLVKVCPLNTSTEPLGNIFLENLETIRENIRLTSLKEQLCNNDQNNSHCKNCSYKVLSPILGKVFE